MMPIRWLTIIFGLVSGFIPVYSRTLPKGHEDQRWTTGSAIDSVDDGSGEEEDPSFKPSLDTSGTIEASIKIQKAPVRLDCQGATGHRREREASSEKEEHRNQFLRCKDCQRDARMIAALSRIAKVRVAGGDPVITARRSKETGIDARGKSTYSLDDDNSAGNTVENTRVTSSITPLGLSSNGVSNRAANGEIKQRSVRCRAKGDVYITDVGENVPSYTCKLGNNVFLLASKRFRRDRRNNLDVGVDDDTLRRLNNASLASTEINPRTIEVVLALKPDGEDYEIRNRT
ncbi:PREDICTED: uncharacterized protein LOC106748247 [Dinoponera quadriceps]|uniref:Uncharacterized protein LOC106748247 n=1 Tax=Dinoponera quadriceps TaxID=609295 RepID=A0A6P3XU77_DINQU|nr:PREDICTED: uncharacterized protein LOC106748247 [Dinoponera quadriceps]